MFMSIQYVVRSFTCLGGINKTDLGYQVGSGNKVELVAREEDTQILTGQEERLKLVLVHRHQPRYSQLYLQLSVEQLL